MECPPPSYPAFPSSPTLWDAMNVLRAPRDLRMASWQCAAQTYGPVAHRNPHHAAFRRKRTHAGTRGRRLLFLTLTGAGYRLAIDRLSCEFHAGLLRVALPCRHSNWRDVGPDGLAGFVRGMSQGQLKAWVRDKGLGISPLSAGNAASRREAAVAFTPFCYRLSAPRTDHRITWRGDCTRPCDTRPKRHHAKVHDRRAAFV